MARTPKQQIKQLASAVLQANYINCVLWHYWDIVGQRRADRHCPEFAVITV